MPAELGQNKFGAGVCSTLDDLRAATEMLSAAIDHPTLPTSNNVVNVVNVVWSNGDGDLIVNGIPISITTSSLTATPPLYITAGDIALAYGSGLTVVDIDGVITLITTGEPTIDIVAGVGIDVDLDTISVALAADEPCLEFDDADDLQLQINDTGGLERTADGVRDKWRYHLVRGTAKGASYDPSLGSIAMDNVTSAHGETPVASSADEITCSGLPLYCDNNDFLFAKYDNLGSADDPLDAWTTDTMANLRPIMAGFPNYDPTKDMVLVHDANEKTDTQQQMAWVERTPKIIWGLDPGGGHTITTTGTTLTLTLKVTRYTFDAVNLTDETDQDVTITYTGTGCT